VAGNLLEFNELADAEQYRAGERMRVGEWEADRSPVPLSAR
jgi:hypothetical protein